MTAGSGHPTRRAFIARLMATAAWPIAASGAFPERAFAAPICEGASTPSLTLTVGRSGDRCLQLLLEEHFLDIPAPVEVPKDAALDWSPNPDDRFGGKGRFGGVAGNFSGRNNTTTPQLFFPWPMLTGQVPHVVDPREASWTGALPADIPDTWEVLVDGSAVAVEAVFRKTVPIRTARTEPENLVHDSRHLLSLILARPVPPGARIEIRAPGLEVPVATESRPLPSEAVHVCHAGYSLLGPKKAYVGLWLGVDRNGNHGSTDRFLSDNTTWRLVDDDTGETVMLGLLRLSKPVDEPHLEDLNFNGCDIYEADFSLLDHAGTFRVVVDGFGSSVPFQVDENPYAEVFRLAARWYFHQRSGCAIDAEHGEGRVRPRNGHPEDGLAIWQTGVQLGRTSEGFMWEPYSPVYLARQPRDAASPDAWGGWHDAGDWDRRVQHMDAVYQMATMVEMFDSARNLHMNIPESGKTFADPAVQARKNADDLGDGETVLPDLIHEALWGVSLWRRTQMPDGGIIGGVEYSLDGIAGSVSWNPLQRTYAYAPEEWAAYRFVEGAAKLGHVIATVCGDEVLGAALLAEAEEAWTWAEAQYASGSANDSETSAKNVGRSRLRAAAVLYRATGNPDARQAFDMHNPFLPRSPEGNFDTGPGHYSYACYDYVLARKEGRSVDDEIADKIAGWVAGKLSWEQRIGQDYGLHNTSKYGWGAGWFRFGPGSNWRAGEVGLDYLATGGNAARIRDIVIEGMWFGLGCNPSNTSFVQGLGKRDFGDPLVVDLEGFCMVPGQVSLGVAAGEMRDFEKQKLARAIHPASQDQWPRYAQIFESSSAVLCAEFDMRGNVLEWLFACGFACEVIEKAKAHKTGVN